jgi:hypothetical protein
MVPDPDVVTAVQVRIAVAPDPLVTVTEVAINVPAARAFGPAAFVDVNRARLERGPADSRHAVARTRIRIPRLCSRDIVSLPVRSSES